MNLLTRYAAILIFASALIHLLPPILSGFTSTSPPQMVFAVLCILLGFMVIKNKRWGMWLSFFAMLFGGISGMAGYVGGSVMPNWVSLMIWFVSWVAAACLFIVLWRDHVLSAPSYGK